MIQTPAGGILSGCVQSKGIRSGLIVCDYNLGILQAGGLQIGGLLHGCLQHIEPRHRKKISRFWVCCILLRMFFVFRSKSACEYNCTSVFVDSILVLILFSENWSFNFLRVVDNLRTHQIVTFSSFRVCFILNLLLNDFDVLEES